jgi:hypothetical protein
LSISFSKKSYIETDRPEKERHFFKRIVKMSFFSLSILKNAQKDGFEIILDKIRVNKL